MFPIKIKTCIETLILAFFMSSVKGQDRKINATLHPGCEVCTENDTLIYIRAEGAHDTLHQIWDFTRGIPSMMLAVAGVNSSMRIAWNKTQPIRFKFSEKPKYGFATVIDKLYEYNDVHDNGYIDKDSERRPVWLGRTMWWPRKKVLTNQEVMLQLRGYVRDHTRSGVIDIKLDLLPFEDYAVELPHLIHTANSSLLDVALVNFTGSPDFNASRYALNLLMVGQDPGNGNFTSNVRKSLDDEHTPGVFEIVEVRAPVESGAGGFLQFRPVCYTQAQRTVGSSSRAYLSAPTKARIPMGSTVEAFFRAWQSPLLPRGALVSFGEPSDGYYRQHNYTAWSSTVGYGSPPVEGFSTFVMSVIACGLAAPALLALAGGAYAVGRRRPDRATRLRDDN